MISAKVVCSARPKLTKLPIFRSTAAYFAQFSPSTLLMMVLVMLLFAFRTLACQCPLLLLRSVTTFTAAQ